MMELAWKAEQEWNSLATERGARLSHCQAVSLKVRRTLNRAIRYRL